MQLKRMKTTVEVKTIGSSGQISLGKKNAGRAVTVEEIENGVWLVKVARVIPESCGFTVRPPARRSTGQSHGQLKILPRSQISPSSKRN
jgi:hypothetical protein